MLIDCGEDWLGRLAELRPRAILVTHAHPDHALGLRDGAPCPVWATEASWKTMAGFAIDRRHTVTPRRPFQVRGITFEAFPVEHSTRCPAVGYRISAGRATLFYVPDVAYIPDREKALRGVEVYVGDGATLERTMVRRRGERLIGHVPVRTQLTWCEKEGVPRAIFSHCGTQIVAGDERVLGARLRALARERGVQARFAYDGMETVVR